MKKSNHSRNNDNNDKADNNDNDNGIPYDRDRFTRELGLLLREIEDKNNIKTNERKGKNHATSSSTKNKLLHDSQERQELVYTTYQNFCYDHPVHSTVQGCEALYEEIITVVVDQKQQQQYYALSNRFVEGIQYCIDHYVITSTPPPSTTTVTTDTATNTTAGSPTTIDRHSDSVHTSSLLKDDTNVESTTISSATISLSSSSLPLKVAYSTLGWMIYGKIPLLCLLCNDPIQETTKQLLGSYSIPESTLQQQPQQDENQNNDDQQQQEQQINDFLLQQQNATNGHSNSTTDNNNNNNNNNTSTHDPIESDEIWATESDPSDYDFESGYNIEQQLLELDTWAEQIQAVLDPIKLSQSNSITYTIHHVQTIVSHLLINLTCTLLDPIPDQQWKTYQLSQQLTQMILILLIPQQYQSNLPFFQNSNSTNNTPPNLPSTNSTADVGTTQQQQQFTHEHWQQLGLHVLNVFRDVTIQRMMNHQIKDVENRQSTNHHNHHHPIILDEYLQLIMTLLKVYDIQLQSLTPSIKNNVTIPPATLVGLSSLSAICQELVLHDQQQSSTTTTTVLPRHHHKNNIQIVQSMIQQCSDDLTILLEILTTNSKKEMEDKHAVQWTYLSFFQIMVLSTTTTTTTSVSSSSTAGTMNIEMAQVLLNSGLFRQWLVSWSTLLLPPVDTSAPNHESETTITTNPTNDNKALQLAIEDCIFTLCLSSPTLLGKYAWRFPSLSQQVTQQQQQQQQEVNSYDQLVKDNENYVPSTRILLWNLLGIHLLELSEPTNSSTVSKVIWKTKQSSGVNNKSLEIIVPVTLDSCYEQVWRLFQYMSQQVLRIVMDWKLRKENDLEISSNKNPQRIFMNEFEKVMNQIITNPLLNHIFCYQVPNRKVVVVVDIVNHYHVGDDRTNPTLHTTRLIRNEMNPIMNLLQQWPTTTTKRMVDEKDEPKLKKEKDEMDHDKNHDDDNNNNNNDQVVDSDNTQDDAIGEKKGTKLHNNRTEEDLSIMNLRKCMKMLFTSLDHYDHDHHDTTTKNSQDGNNRMTKSISSKTD